MIRILGLYIPDKEDRKKKEREVLYQYFPYGESHKEKIGTLLSELVPNEKTEYLIMYYMQIKERMGEYDAKKFDESVKQIRPKYIIIHVNDKVIQYYKAVMEADSKVGEKLELPSAEEIRKMVDVHEKNSFV